MNKNLRILFLVFATLGFSACAQKAQVTSAERAPNQIADSASGDAQLQTLKRDLKFNELMAGLNLNDPAFTFEYKTGGTSIGLHIRSGEKKLGKWLPRNGAANPEAQVVGYRLGRYLHMAENVAPSAYYTLNGKGLSNFAQMMKNHGPEKNKWREENRQSLLKAFQANSTEMLGVFSDAPSTYEVVEVQDTNHNTINAHHPLAAFVRADGPQPSANKRLSFKGVKKPDLPAPTESELELARQLSKILVLDVLLWQWDRWSGGNFEAAISKEDNRVYFIARDNGGAALSSGDSIRGINLVSRFDHQQIDSLKQLVSQLKDPAQSPLLIASLQIRSNTKLLLARAEAILAKVDEQTRRYGANAFFP